MYHRSIRLYIVRLTLLYQRHFMEPSRNIFYFTSPNLSCIVGLGFLDLYKQQQLQYLYFSQYKYYNYYNIFS